MEAPIGKFDLSKANLEKINTLNGLDNDHRFMEFKFDEGNVKVSGKSYDLLIEEKPNDNAELSIFKDQYSTLDVENYTVVLAEDRLVFTSIDSNTVTVISKAEDKD